MDVTRSYRLKSAILCSILVLTIFTFVSPVKAEDPADNLIDADFDVEFVSATEFKITAELDVEKITLSVNGRTYDKDGISSIASSDQILLGAISYEVSSQIKNLLNNTFKYAIVEQIQEVSIYQNTLFHDTFSIYLTSKYFDLDDTVSSYEFINGVLNMGAVLDYDIDLIADVGWNVNYTFDLGEKYNYQHTNGAVTNKEIRYSVVNKEGSDSLTNVLLSIYEISPTTNKPVEDISVEFNIDVTNEINSVNVSLLAKNISIVEYDILPDCVSNLKNVTSDGVRLFVKNNLLTLEEIKANSFDVIEDEIKNKIQTDVFNQTLDFSFSWENTSSMNSTKLYDVENMNNEPPFTAFLEDNSVNIEILNIPSFALFGLINTGAVINLSEVNNPINFADNLKTQSFSYPYILNLILPENITLEDLEIFSWDEDANFSGVFESDNPTLVEEESKNTIIEIEIKTTDLNILSFFTGDAQLNFGTDFYQKESINISDVTQDSAYFKMPKGIKLHKNLLISDAYRLLVEQNVFSTSKIDSFLNDRKTVFENRMTNLFPDLEITGELNNDEYKKSLKWDNDISKMDSDKSIQIIHNAYSSYPLSIEVSTLPPSVGIPVLTYNFTGLKNQSVTYKIVFPEGAELEINDPSNKAKIKTKDGNKKYLEITFNSSEANLSVEVTCKLKPSVFFMLGLFAPCILTAFITIILILVVLFLRRKKRFLHVK